MSSPPKTLHGLAILGFVLLCMSGFAACGLRDNEKEFNTLFAKGNDLADQGDLKQAITYYNEALDRTTNLAQRSNLKSIALMALANTYFKLNQYDDAARTCSQALVVLRSQWKANGLDFEKRDGLVVAKASLLLGQIYRKQEKYSEAENAFKYALQTEEECLGPLYFKDELIQNYAELLKHLGRDKEAARLTRNDNESLLSVYEQSKMAHHLIDIGNLQGAMSALDEAYALVIDNNLMNADAVSCVDMYADTSYKLGKYEQANKAAKQELEIIEKSRIHAPMAIVHALTITGKVALQNGDLTNADHDLIKAFTLSQQAPEAGMQPIIVAECMRAVGALREKQHDYRSANELLSHALKIYTNLGPHPRITAAIKADLARLKTEQH